MNTYSAQEGFVGKVSELLPCYTLQASELGRL